MASTCAGALAAGVDPQPWHKLGATLGEAYQVAVDIRDVMMQADQLGKPAGQDAHHGRPSAAADLRLVGALDYFSRLMKTAADSVPVCESRNAMRKLVLMESERLVPPSACEMISRQQPMRSGRVSA